MSLALALIGVIILVTVAVLMSIKRDERRRLGELLGTRPPLDASTLTDEEHDQESVSTSPLPQGRWLDSAATGQDTPTSEGDHLGDVRANVTAPACSRRSSIIGRAAEAATLYSILTSLRRSPPVCLIYGPPGAGKTLLVLSVAREVARRYKDGIAYFDAEAATVGLDGPLPAQVLDVLTGGDRRNPQKSEDCKSYLERSSTLLIIDNAHMVRDLTAVLPETGRSAIVVISPRILRVLPTTTHMRVAQLKRAASEMLLRQAIQYGTSLQDTSPICDVLDDNALAITSAADAITASPNVAHVILEMKGLRPTRRRVFELVGDGSLAQTFGRAIGGLSEDHQNLLHVLSATEGIRFCELFAATLLRNLGSPYNNIHEDLEQLVDGQLVEAEGGGYRLSPLVCEYLQTLSGDPAPELRQTCTALTDALRITLATLSQSPAEFEAFVAESFTAESALTFREAAYSGGPLIYQAIHLIKVLGPSELAQPHVRQLAWTLIAVLRSRRQWLDIQSVVSAFTDVPAAVQAGDLMSRKYCTWQLAACAAEVGQRSVALTLFEAAFDQSDALASDTEAAQLHLDAGEVQEAAGEFSKARYHYQQASSLFGQGAGFDIAQGRLTSVAARDFDDGTTTAEAKDPFDLVRHHTNGPTRIGVLLHDAALAERQGQGDEAVVKYQDAIAIASSINLQYLEVRARRRLGHFHLKRGRAGEAATEFRIIATDEETSDLSSATRIEDLVSLAYAELAAGQVLEAFKAVTRAAQGNLSQLDFRATRTLHLVARECQDLVGMAPLWYRNLKWYRAKMVNPAGHLKMQRAPASARTRSDE